MDRKKKGDIPYGLEFSKGLVFYYHDSPDERHPFLSQEQIEFAEQFPHLADIDLDLILDVYSQYENSLNDELTILDEHVHELTSDDSERQFKADDNDIYNLWYRGELDESFYYGERNRELMIEHLEELHKEKQLEKGGYQL